MKNFYEVLNIKKTADQNEIKSAFINLVKKYHPDTFDGDKDFAIKMTSQITEAYNTLKDKTLRKKYDDIILATEQSLNPKQKEQKEKQTLKQNPTKIQPETLVKEKTNLINKQTMGYDIAIGVLVLLLILVIILFFVWISNKKTSFNWLVFFVLQCF